MTGMLGRRRNQGPGGKRADELGARRAAGGRKRRALVLLVSGLVLVTILFAVWSIFFVMTHDREEVRLSFLREGEIEESLGLPLVFLEEGTRISAPASGLLIPLAQEGQRLAKDGELALIVAPDKEREALLYKEAEAQYKARLFQVSGFADPTRFQTPRSPADSQLREAIRELINQRSQRNLEALNHQTAGLEDLVRQITPALSLFAGKDDQLEKLAGECQTYLAYLRADPRTVLLRAPLAGEVSYRINDWPQTEEVWAQLKLDPDRVISQLEESARGSGDLGYQLVTQGGDLAILRRFGGLTLASWLSHDHPKAQLIRKGTKLDIRDPESGLELPDCQVEALEENPQGWILRLTCPGARGSLPAEGAYGEVIFVLARTAGLRVSLSSLIDLDPEEGRAGLRRVKGGVTETIRIRLTASDGTFAIIEAEDAGETLSQTDLYVVNPWRIEDGQLIG